MAAELNVLVVLPSLGAGGAERSTVESLDPLRARGLQVEIVVLGGVPGGVHGDDLGDHVVHSLADLRARAKPLRLREIIRSRKPDLVHTAVFDADVVGRLAAFRTGTPLLSSLVNTQYDLIRRKDPAVSIPKLRVVQAIEVATARLSGTKFHAISGATRDAGIRDLRIRPEAIRVVPRGRKRERLGEFSPERRLRTRTALGIAADTPVVLNVGRQEWQKGQSVLIEAAAELRIQFPNVVVLIAGRPGNCSDALAADVRRLGLDNTVRFLGHVEQVPDLLCAADVFAFPSRYEGLGGALIEAMALGVPIVTTRTPATMETVGEAARLIGVDDAGALVESVADLLVMGRPSALTASAQRRFDLEYEFESVMDRMERLYRWAIGQ